MAPRRSPPRLRALALPVLLAASVGLGSQRSQAAAASVAGKRPNIILILTDDQDAHTGGDWHMPKLRKYLASEGANFTIDVANYSRCGKLCCALPLPHHHPDWAVRAQQRCGGRLGRDAGRLPPLHHPRPGEEDRPGLPAAGGLPHRPRWQAEGPQYLNQYTTEFAYHVPPGWERWFAIAGDKGPDYYQWTVSDQGVLRRFGDAEEDYSTDVVAREAVKFIREAQTDDRPFFLYTTPYACHRPHVPARRHIDTFKGLKIPRVPSWNESDEHLSKKVSFLRGLPAIDEDTAAALDYEYQTRAETLLAVDDLIEDLIQALEETGQLDDTYIFYTADNGFKLGHHRIPGKMSPYDADVRLPFYVRGPGVPHGVELTHLVGNVDFSPTWLELAGVPDPLAGHRDGISLVPILRADEEVLADPDRHRVGILIEKPATTGGYDKHMPILTPVRDPLDDVFEGYRPVLLPNATWPAEILDWEHQGRNFPATWQAYVEKGLAGGVADPIGYSSMFGYMLYCNMTRERGLKLEAVMRAGNEDFPSAHYGLCVVSHRLGLKLKYIEWPDGRELYDLHADPHEVDNLFERAPRVRGGQALMLRGRPG
ncbi:hypothetical protein ABPG75_006711 [Micractinium tetrahymenae]